MHEPYTYCILESVVILNMVAAVGFVTRATMEHFKSIDNFVFDGHDVSQRWVRWQKQFENYFAACELEKKHKETQVAILLHTAGAEAQEIHEQFTFQTDDEKKDYKVILKKFKEYCHPRKNTVYERYCFWSRDQVEGEPIDKWVKDLT